jgi:hypothetical protein
MEQATTENNREMTREDLCGKIKYNPESGLFFKTGSLLPCGFLNNRGYVVIVLNKKMHLAHRLAFLIMENRQSTKQIDHINGIKHDNRWKNLREATNSQNKQNSKKQKNNTSGLKGVCKCDDANRKTPWRARIRLNNKLIHIGRFKTKEEAKAAYDAKAIELFKEFARLV